MRRPAALAASLVALVGMVSWTPARSAGGPSDPAQWTPPEAKLRDWGTGGWTAENTLLQAAITGAHLVAAGQTADCMRLTACYEKGVLSSALYGERQTVNEVYKFAAIRSVAAWALAYYGLDNPARIWGQGAMLTVGLLDVRHNQREDLKPDWGPMWFSLGVGIAISKTF